jgi:hypothetical protein
MRDEARALRLSIEARMGIPEAVSRSWSVMSWLARLYGAAAQAPVGERKRMAARLTTPPATPPDEPWLPEPAILPAPAPNEQPNHPPLGPLDLVATARGRRRILELLTHPDEACPRALVAARLEDAAVRVRGERALCRYARMGDDWVAVLELQRAGDSWRVHDLRLIARASFDAFGARESRAVAGTIG